MHNFLDPAILFFLIGALAGAVKSNLEVPHPIARFLSLYLLMALGLKGGFALQKSGFTLEIGLALGLAVFLATLIPLMGYALLRTRLNPLDSAAVAATYGSVSAVTFITATQALDQSAIAYGGYMAAAMALMESPAIILAVLLANKARAASAPTTQAAGMSKILHESFTDGGQFLLLGSMVVGLLSGASGEQIMAPFSIDLFKGMLAFFLLDMGLMAAKNFGGFKDKPSITWWYALGAPMVHAALALGLCKCLGLPLGDTVLLMVLAASASYIAVPAVLRHAMPEVNPALYMGMSLGVTFPFNIILGIPLYTFVAKLTY
jgi:hypothetical protein